MILKYFLPKLKSCKKNIRNLKSKFKNQIERTIVDKKNYNHQHELENSLNCSINYDSSDIYLCRLLAEHWLVLEKWRKYMSTRHYKCKVVHVRSYKYYLLTEVINIVSYSSLMTQYITTDNWVAFSDNYNRKKNIVMHTSDFA